MARSRYFFHSHLFTFYSLVQLLFPKVKLKGASQPISTEYKMVHAQVKLCLEHKISKTQQSWVFPVFSYVLEQVSNVTLHEKNWVISVTTSQR